MPSSYCVDHFRAFFEKHSSAESIDALTEAEREDFAAACWAGFMSFGDPRCWDGFDGLSDMARYALNSAYENWPGPPDAKLVIPPDTLVS